MNPAEYDNLARLEETHWWFVTKRMVVAQCLAQFGPANWAHRRLVDVGCGAGAVLTRHRALTGSAFGLDYAAAALAYAAAKHGGRLAQADTITLPLASASVDGVTALNVLYHRWVADDQAALAEIYRVLRPGGLLIIIDSAFDCLSGPHDETNLGVRRYTVPQLRQKLQCAGFTIKKESYLNLLLFGPVFLYRRFQRAFSPARPDQSDLWPVPAWLNRALIRAYQAELAWLRIGGLPMGLNLLVVAQK